MEETHNLLQIMLPVGEQTNKRQSEGSRNHK